VNVTSNATGGNGGQRVGASTVGGTGGNAQANASGSGLGSTNATATATGGTGNGGSNSGTARADAKATGTAGQAQANATSAGGLITNVDGHVYTNIPNNTGTAISAASAAVGQTSPTDTAGKHALAFATGLPTGADVSTRFAGNPNVAATFGQPNAQSVGLMYQGGGYAGQANGQNALATSIADLSLNITQISNKQFLLLGMLDPVVTGSGFDTLRFRVNREGVLVVDQTFITVASAMSYFHDKVLQISDWTTGVSLDNILDLQFTLDVASTKAGSAFSTDFLVGNATIAAIPEPSTYVLFAFGLVGLLTVARRRRLGLRVNV
jgi:hypothetical protein